MDTYEISQFTAMVIALLTVLGLTGVLLCFFIRRQKRHRQELKHYAAEEVNRIEKERSRLSMDLHDDIRSMLAAARLQLMLVKEGGEQAGEHASRAFQCIDQLGLRLQEISRNLSPRTLALRGLKEAIHCLLKTMHDSGAMRVSLDYQLRREPSDETRVHLYRMVQELLHNALKHSGAGHVSLRLEEGKKMLRLLYRDDGKGFSYSEATTGLGLSHLRSRVALLDGNMDMRSAPGQGTHYVFEIPHKLPQ